MPKYTELPPRADAMIESMRAIGYDLSMALADLIDNSIFAEAHNIFIDYQWDGRDSWILILDDGSGMNETELHEAMRFGSQNPNEERDPRDLGRFGLGLKTASFSQCRVHTVITKIQSGEKAARYWDLNHVSKVKKWELGIGVPNGINDIIKRMDNVDHGTLVLWQQLDRILGESISDDKTNEDIFLNKFLDVREYLEMVFHRYLSLPSPLSIHIGKSKLKPWDPYLRTNLFTQELANEKYEDGTVRVIPYVLPHVSHRSAQENEIGAGPKGWNAQQGFYVYRNKRMIVSGGYLNFSQKQEEHCKLARIMVDISNEMDKDWGIDVRKATAIPPDRLRAELQKVAKATRSEAIKVFRARIGGTRKSPHTSNQDVWQRKKRGDNIVYQINKDNDVLKNILSEISFTKSWLNRLFHIIETTVPHRLIIMDNAENEDCHVGLPPEINQPPAELIDLCKEFYYERRKSGKTHEQAADLVCAIEPFNTHVAYRAALDSLAECKE
jgi:hypothetical protein